MLTCVGTTLAVGLAGCSSDGGGSTEDGDGTPTGTTGEQTESTTAAGSKPLTLELLGTSSYQSEVVTVESLTFVAAGEDADSPTLQVGETVGISEEEYQDAVVVADDLAVPYGTYESVEMTVTPEEVIDGEGSSVDVSARTVSQSFTDIDDEPTTVEESPFDATLTLSLSIQGGQFEVTGYRAVEL